MAREKKLFSLLQKVIFFSQALGTYPYNELIQSDSWQSIWVLYQACIFITIQAIAFRTTRFQYDGGAKRIMFYLFVSLTRLVVSTLPTINFAILLIKRQTMKEIFDSLIEVDSRLEMLGYHPRYNLERRITYFSFLFTILSVLSFALAMENRLDCYLDTFHLAVGLSTTFANLQFITDLIFIAGQQFQLIKTCLVKSCNQTRVEFFIELHSKVSLVCFMLNKVFTNQMLMISFVVFFHTTVTIHAIVDRHLSFFQVLNSKMAIARICMTCVHLILGYVLVNTCVWTGIQSKDFTQILHLMILEDETDKLCQNKKVALHVAMKKEVVYTACGFFNIDFKLIHSMVAAATTYLIVLLQFSQQFY